MDVGCGGVAMPTALPSVWRVPIWARGWNGGAADVAARD